MRERSIWISTTSPSMISLSSLILTPMDFLNACVKASVFDISYEKISDAEIIVNGVSSPNDFAIPTHQPCCPHKTRSKASERLDGHNERENTHGDGGFPRARRTSDKHGPPSDFSLLDHLQDYACGFTGLELADHALRGEAWLERIIEADAADVRMVADSFDCHRQISCLCHCRDRVLRLALAAGRSTMIEGGT